MKKILLTLILLIAVGEAFAGLQYFNKETNTWTEIGNTDTSKVRFINGNDTVYVASGSIKMSKLQPGAVLYTGVGDTIKGDSSNIYYDAINNFLGVNTRTPTIALDVTTKLHLAMGTARTPTSTPSDTIISVQAGGFANIWEADKVIANGMTRWCLSQNGHISSDTLRLDSIVNWWNGGSGYSYDHKPAPYIQVSGDSTEERGIIWSINQNWTWAAYSRASNMYDRTFQIGNKKSRYDNLSLSEAGTVAWNKAMPTAMSAPVVVSYSLFDLYRPDFDVVWRKVATYTDNTAEARTSYGTAFSVVTSTNDTLLVGKDGRYSSMLVDFLTSATSATIVVQYWNGSTWTTMTAGSHSFVDSTINFTRDGYLQWDLVKMKDWQKKVINSQNRYFIRIYTTALVGTPTARAICPIGRDMLAIHRANGDADPQLAIDEKGFIRKQVWSQKPKQVFKEDIGDPTQWWSMWYSGETPSLLRGTDNDIGSVTYLGTTTYTHYLKLPNFMFPDTVRNWFADRDSVCWITASRSSGSSGTQACSLFAFNGVDTIIRCGVSGVTTKTTYWFNFTTAIKDSMKIIGRGLPTTYPCRGLWLGIGLKVYSSNINEACMWNFGIRLKWEDHQ